MKLDKSGRKVSLNTKRVVTPNDPKLSHGRAWRAGCAVGGKVAAVFLADCVTCPPVGCSAWLGLNVRFRVWRSAVIASSVRLLCFAWRWFRVLRSESAGLNCGRFFRRDKAVRSSGWSFRNSLTTPSSATAEAGAMAARAKAAEQPA